jgi:prophage DNA circulation protein
MPLTDDEAKKLKKDALTQQQRLKEKLQKVDATELNQEQLVDYTFCVNKNFLAIKNINNSLLADVIDEMRKTENELKNGIESLKAIIDQVNNQAALLAQIDKVISIVVRLVRIFA